MTASTTESDPLTDALAGVRVIDFTRQMAGPYGTVLLGDYGADVVKVESMPDGDGSRRVGNAFMGGESSVFLMWNRSKRGIAVDLHKPEGLEVVRRLVADADVVVENYRPGVADKIGIGYEALAAINPRLVYCSVSAWGQSGPLSSFPGTDPVVQAASGVMSVTGEPDRGPDLVGVPIADFTGAMQCAQGVMLGLLARERTGKGQHIEVSMLGGLLSALTTRLASYWTTGEDPGRHGSSHSTTAPYQAFQTADGYVVAGVWGDEGWPKFCTVVDRPDLVDDERFKTNLLRVQNAAALTSELVGTFRSKSSEAWEKKFHGMSVLFSRVFSFSEILNHPHVEQAGYVTTVDHPTLGAINQFGPVIGMSDTPGKIRRPPPLYGEHTEEVLLGAGLQEDEISALRETGAIFTR